MKTIRVSSSFAACSGLNTDSVLAAPEKQWSLGEWIANFISADLPLYDNFEPDDWDAAHVADTMGPDQEYYDDIDQGIIDSLIIISLAAALALLVFYRQQRQLNHRRAREQQAAAAAANPNTHHDDNNAAQNPEREEDRGVFPRVGNPDYNNWVAGGIGH